MPPITPPAIAPPETDDLEELPDVVEVEVALADADELVNVTDGCTASEDG